MEAGIGRLDLAGGEACGALRLQSKATWAHANWVCCGSRILKAALVVRGFTLRWMRRSWSRGVERVLR